MNSLTTRQKVQHLYWRAGFAMSANEWYDRQSWTLSQAINELLDSGDTTRKLGKIPDNLPADQKSLRAMSKDDRKIFNKENVNNLVELRKTWQDRMGSQEFNPLHEKMTLFWHGHFASHSRFYHFTMIQQNMLRQHALGSFRDLVHGISKDPVMLNYLNNQQNKKRSPNENFARELCELFTLGIGNYSENDIKEAARAFTGWRTDLSGNFKMVNSFHDFDRKSFLGQSGNFNGEDIVDIILEKRETARFITTKIYRFFVHQTVNPNHVNDLSNVFYDSGYNIKTLMRTIFESDWFYKPEVVASRIKSPIELIAGMQRQTNLDIRFARQIAYLQKAMGQLMFKPPNVAGWPDGKSWIDNQTLLLRLNLPAAVSGNAEIAITEQDSLKAKQTARTTRKINGKMDLAPLYSIALEYSNDQLFSFLSEFLLATTPRLPQSKIEAGLDRSNRSNYIKQMVIRLMSMPEYQVC